jgi:hypothetical protein
LTAHWLHASIIPFLQGWVQKAAGGKTASGWIALPRQPRYHEAMHSGQRSAVSSQEKQKAAQQQASAALQHNAGAFSTAWRSKHQAIECL